MKKGTAIQNRFMTFMRTDLDRKSFDSPMSLYQAFVANWGKPLNPKNLEQAYLAAWAFSIDNGLVEL